MKFIISFVTQPRFIKENIQTWVTFADKLSSKLKVSKSDIKISYFVWDNISSGKTRTEFGNEYSINSDQQEVTDAVSLSWHEYDSVNLNFISYDKILPSHPQTKIFLDKLGITMSDVYKHFIRSWPQFIIRKIASDSLAQSDPEAWCFMTRTDYYLNPHDEFWKNLTILTKPKLVPKLVSTFNDNVIETFYLCYKGMENRPAFSCWVNDQILLSKSKNFGKLYDDQMAEIFASAYNSYHNSDSLVDGFEKSMGGIPPHQVTPWFTKNKDLILVNTIPFTLLAGDLVRYYDGDKPMFSRMI